MLASKNKVNLSTIFRAFAVKITVVSTQTVSLWVLRNRLICLNNAVESVCMNISLLSSSVELVSYAS